MALTVADAIKAVRERRGFSARALSLAANLSPSYVGKVESGQITDLSLAAFAAISSVLNLAPQEIYLLVREEAARHFEQH